jgi:predicted nucleic acid-binding protein
VNSFVLDASVTLGWCFPDESTEVGWDLLARAGTEGAIVPSHWALEVANTLLVAERGNRVTREEVATFELRLAALSIEMDMLTHARAMQETTDIARRHGLTSYDAAYLELARRRDLPLATRDRQLATAARAHGLETIEP